MAAVASAGTVARENESKNSFWLRDRKWDLLFITFSVIVVPLPYLFYLAGRDIFGINDDVARNVVNGFVAIDRVIVRM